MNDMLDRFWNSQNGIKYLVITMIGMMTISLIIVVASIFRPIQKDPPIEYDSNAYVLADKDFCPGETMHYGITITINEAPTVINIFDAVWSISKNQTAVYSKGPIFTIVTEKGVVERDLEYIIPDLPPGNYEYRRAASSNLSSPSFFVIPFTILETCP